MLTFVKEQLRSRSVFSWIAIGAAALLMLAAVVLLAGIFLVILFGPTLSPNADASPGTSTTAPVTEPTHPPLPDNPYSAGDFAYRNGYLTCLAGESLLGVDVSSHQGYINWQQVADAGIQFAMIRIGYRGYGNGETVEDTFWKENLQGARAAGLQVGIYFFSQAITVEEAEEEAQLAISWLGGTPLDLPIVFDWEPISDTARTANMDAETLNACALAFSEKVKAAGYEPMVYFNLDTSTRLLDLPLLQEAGYHFWLALYKDTMTYPYRIHMWQYTDGGSVAGINGNVDINLYFTYNK